MKRTTKPLALVLTLAGVLSMLLYAWATAVPSQPDPARGKKLYSVKCVACHKTDGSGGFKLSGNPTPDWRNAKLMASPAHSDSALCDCITNGRVKSGMVAWVKSGALKATQVPDLIAYIHTFDKKK